MRIAQGSYWSARWALLTQVVVALLVGAIVGFGVSVADSGIGDVRSWLEGMAILGAGFACAGVLAALYTMTWWISASRVSYVYDDGILAAYRGKRLVKSFDVKTYRDIVFDGETSVHGLFIGVGSIASLNADLPRLRFREASDSPWVAYEEFPPVLIVGSRDADVVRAKLAKVLSTDGFE